MIRRMGLVIVLALLGLYLYGQAPPVQLSFEPGLTIPVGTNASLLSVGGGGTISGDYTLPFFPLLAAGVEVGYTLAPMALQPVELGKSLSTFNAGALLRLRYELMPRVTLHADVAAGWFYSLLNNDPSTTGNHPYLAAGGGVSYDVLPALSVGAGVGYRYYSGLFGGVEVGLGTTLKLGQGAAREAAPAPAQPRPQPLDQKPAGQPSAAANSGLDFTAAKFNEIFPVFFKYYDRNPIGTATLRNFENSPAENVRVSFFVKQYMDNPKAAPAPVRLEPGEEKQFDLYGLFTNAVLDITEGTTVSALITVTYVMNGKELTRERIETIGINNRNALTWDDDRKASAFVTAKDPAVLKFSKNVSGWVKTEQSGSLHPNLFMALSLHEALDLYGLNYAVDPTTPYTSYSASKTAIDFLQFPKQTLEYRGGDCDDLSILYAALLESLGIETAFVTTPGHIFVAFSLDMSEEQARKSFRGPDELIFRENKAWVPVEITVRGAGFLKAWAAGAKEWRESEQASKSGFFPLRKAWEVYQPVGLPGTTTVEMPDKTAIVTAARAERDRVIARDLGPQESSLLAQLQKSPADKKLRNSLGVLYARFGLAEKADAEFKKAIKDKPYLPSLVNLGNLAYLRGDLKVAQDYYGQAAKLSPRSPTVVLGQARVEHDLENYGSARTAYATLKEVAPDLADQFSYLALRGDESVRAADAMKTRGVVVWAE